MTAVYWLNAALQIAYIVLHQSRFYVTGTARQNGMPPERPEMKGQSPVVITELGLG